MANDDLVLTTVDLTILDGKVTRALNDTMGSYPPGAARAAVAVAIAHYLIGKADDAVTTMARGLGFHEEDGNEGPAN